MRILTTVVFAILLSCSASLAQDKTKIFRAYTCVSVQVTDKTAVIESGDKRFWFEGNTAPLSENWFLGTRILAKTGTHEYKLATGKVLTLTKVRFATEAEKEEFAKFQNPPSQEEVDRMKAAREERIKGAFARYAAIKKKKISKLRLVNGSVGLQGATLIGFTGPLPKTSLSRKFPTTIDFDVGLTVTHFNVEKHFALSTTVEKNSAQFLTKDGKLVEFEISALHESVKRTLIRKLPEYMKIQNETGVTFAICNGILTYPNSTRLPGKTRVMCRIRDWKKDNPVVERFKE